MSRTEPPCAVDNNPRVAPVDPRAAPVDPRAAPVDPAVDSLIFPRNIDFASESSSTPSNNNSSFSSERSL